MLRYMNVRLSSDENMNRDSETEIHKLERRSPKITGLPIHTFRWTSRELQSPWPCLQNLAS